MKVQSGLEKLSHLSFLHRLVKSASLEINIARFFEKINQHNFHVLDEVVFFLDFPSSSCGRSSQYNYLASAAAFPLLTSTSLLVGVFREGGKP